MAASRFDEERLGELLRSLRPAPDAWTLAAKEIPTLHDWLDEVVARAEADEEFRRALDADLEGALRRAGYEPRPDRVSALRRRL